MIVMIADSIFFDVRFIAAVCTVVGSFCAVVFFFTRRLDARLADKSVLDSIAARLRPELIFTDAGSIIADRGGAALLSDKKIEVVHGAVRGTQAPIKIVVHMKRPVDLAPILTPMNPDTVRITASHDVGNDWRFDIGYGLLSYDDNHPRQRHYRLEFF
jgi:hypothetical protein